MDEQIQVVQAHKYIIIHPTTPTKQVFLMVSIQMNMRMFDTRALQRAGKLILMFPEVLLIRVFVAVG